MANQEPADRAGIDAHHTAGGRQISCICPTDVVEKTGYNISLKVQFTKVWREGAKSSAMTRVVEGESKPHTRVPLRTTFEAGPHTVGRHVIQVKERI